jgi:hydroxylamine reductase (hybrid-cluster protein)
MIFCENCHDEVEVLIKSIRKKTNIKGIEIDYKGKEAYCIECGNVVFVGKIHDYNLDKINKEYEKVRS